VVSALGLVVCVVLVFLPVRRRRRRRVAAEDTVDEADVNASAPSDGGHGPELVASWAGDGDVTEWRPAVVTGAVSGLAAGLISAPLVGGLVGIGIVVVMRKPRLRLLLGGAATVLVLAAATFIIVRQGVDVSQANGGWPSEFGGATGLAWAGILFLGADAVLEIRDRLRGSVPIEPRSAGAPDSAAVPKIAESGSLASDDGQGPSGSA